MEVITGKFKETKPKGSLVDLKTEKVIKPEQLTQIRKPEEKESDVNFAINVISDCYEYELLKGIVIISSDTDLTPVLRMVNNKFPRKRIVHVRMKEKDSVEMRKFAHSRRIITSEDLANSQLPSRIEKDVGDGETVIVEKPKEWM